MNWDVALGSGNDCLLVRKIHLSMIQKALGNTGKFEIYPKPNFCHYLLR